MGTPKADEKGSGAADNESRDIKVTNSAEQDLKESKFNDKCKENASEFSTSLIVESMDAVKKPLLSEEDAAMRIQSAYRGFEVRRWEPVKKLKQIAKIKEQVKEVNDKMCELEANGLLPVDEKQRVIINENIMCLLLQLDTIQSIHPSVREVRKSVAKELICLQEKLDSIIQTASKNVDEAESKINEDDVNWVRSLPPLEENIVIQDEEFVKCESDVTTSIQPSPLALREENGGELPSVENQVDQGKPLGGEEQPSSPQEQVPNTTSEGHLLSAPDPTNQHTSTKIPELELPYDDGLQELPSLECLDIGEEGSSAVGEQAPVTLPAATDVETVEDILVDAAPRSAQHYEAVKPINDENYLVGSEPNEIDVEENNSGPDQSDELEQPLVEKFVIIERDSLEAVVESNDANKSSSETEEAANDKMPATDALPHYGIENVVSKNLGSDAALYDTPLGDEENRMSEVSSSGAEAAAGNTGAEVKEATPSIYLGAEQVINQVADTCELAESEATDHVESPNDEFAAPMTLDQCLVTAACTEADTLTVAKDSEINKGGENTPVDSAAPDQLSGPIKIIEPVASVEESLGVNGKYLVEENEKLRKMVENLVVAGKEQLSAMGELSGRVRELEKQLAKKRTRLRLRNHKRKHASCGASMGNAVEESLTNIYTM